jgi:hypothetical protein
LQNHWFYRLYDRAASSVDTGRSGLRVAGWFTQGTSSPRVGWRMTRLCVSLALGALLVASPARAQSKAAYSVRGEAASYEVAFTDDALLAPGTSAYADWLKVRPPAPRVMLLRPRTSFVPELLTSANAF